MTFDPTQTRAEIARIIGKMGMVLNADDTVRRDRQVVSTRKSKAVV